MVYIVEMTETFTKYVSIHAKSKEEAVAEVNRRYNEGEYDLPWDNDRANFNAKVTGKTRKEKQCQ